MNQILKDKLKDLKNKKLTCLSLFFSSYKNHFTGYWIHIFRNKDDSYIEALHNQKATEISHKGIHVSDKVNVTKRMEERNT